MKRGSSLALLWVCLLASCRGTDSVHVIGTHDVTLRYAVSAEPGAPSAQGSQATAAIARIRDRLLAARLAADLVASGPSTVTVTLDEQEAPAAQALLAWRGGLSVYELDPSAEVTVRAPTALRPRRETGGGLYFQGPPEAVARLLETATVPPGRRIGSEVIDHATSRTRVLREPAVEAVPSGVVSVSKRGGRVITVTLSPEAAAPIARWQRERPAVPVAITRDAAVYYVGVLDGRVFNAQSATLTLPMGTEIHAWRRAQRVRAVLRSGVLPALSLQGSERLPVRWGLTLACLVLPVLLSLMWLVFVRRFDRARPEPWWLVLATFALGGVGVVPAGLAEYLLAQATPYANPMLMTFGGQLFALPIALVVFSVVVGGCEEGVKFLGAWGLAAHRREFDEPVDGLVYSAAASLGFAAAENVLYFTHSRLSGVVVTMRAFLSVPGHMLFGAIWGYALGRRLVAPRARVWPAFLLAALVHGAFDAFLSIDGTPLLSFVLTVGLAATFVWFLRASLRHGVVGPADIPEPDDARTLFAVGATDRFVLSAIAFALTAMMAIVLGALSETLHLRVSTALVVAATVVLALNGLAGYALTHTIPLDVALDRRGVTFHGETRPWESILGIEPLDLVGYPPYPSCIRVRTSQGDTVLGPGSPSVIWRLAQAIEERLRAR